jgi:gliding motility-associated-like protein
LSISETGTYYVSVSGSNCEAVDSVNVVSNNNLQLATSHNNVFCNDSTLISATYSNDVSSVFWSTNNSFTDTLGELDSLIIFSSGVFYVKVINGVCEQIDSIEVLSESINIDVVSNDICLGDSVLIEVQNLHPSIPITVYNWSGFAQTSSSIFVTPDSSRWYSVEVENANGCISSDSTFVNVFYYPIVDSLWFSDSIVYEGATVELNVVLQDTTHIYEIEINESYWYLFEVSNMFGCLVTDSVYIQKKDVFCNDKNIKIPTAFSPNNDGVNDDYYIKDEDSVITNFHLEIFNRFGQKVFSINDKNIKWNGDFNGEKLPPQVFDFYLEISCIGAKTLFHKGNITLIR